ncbi:MAG: ABC transporter ATP-binding protein [Planctomycetota bacterium]|nr:ABC transporter ATP-binding protein [Planctomycetota bacterium]
MILLDDVHKKFGSVHAVQGISFELVPGQIAGLLGPNGAGKTTTIRMVVGYFMPDVGRVLIDGHDTATSAAAARRRVGYMPESSPLYPEMRVADYLAFRGKIFGLDRSERRTALARVIDWCSLGSVAARRIGVLSKGFKQRVTLAAALLHDPPVLVLDEPTNGLDPTQIQEVRTLVRELSAKRTMLISSHILSEVERLCDRIIVVAGGKVRGDGTPQQLAAAVADGRTYSVQGRVADDAAAQRLVTRWKQAATIESVHAQASADGQWRQWTLVASRNAEDPRELIAQAALAEQVLLRELRTNAPTLERAFQSLVEGAAREGRDQ